MVSCRDHSKCAHKQQLFELWQILSAAVLPYIPSQSPGLDASSGASAELIVHSHISIVWVIG